MREARSRDHLSDSMKRKLPVRFDEKHEQAYQYYLELGSGRTFKQVASKFNVSVTTIGNWSLAYGWTDRIREDIQDKNENGLIAYFTKIASVRNNGIEIIDTIMQILKESVDIINAANNEKRELSEIEQKAIVNKRSYLTALGFKVSTGRDLRDFVNALGDIIEFKPGGAAAKKQQPINVSGGSVLILQGLTSENAKEILHANDGEVQALRGSGEFGST